MNNLRKSGTGHLMILFGVLVSLIVSAQLLTPKPVALSRFEDRGIVVEVRYMSDFARIVMTNRTATEMSIFRLVEISAISKGPRTGTVLVMNCWPDPDKPISEMVAPGESLTFDTHYGVSSFDLAPDISASISFGSSLGSRTRRVPITPMAKAAKEPGGVIIGNPVFRQLIEDFERSELTKWD